MTNNIRCIRHDCPLKDKCGTYHAVIPKGKEARRKQPVTAYRVKTIKKKSGKEYITCKGFRYISFHRKQTLMNEGIIPRTRYGKPVGEQVTEQVKL